MKGVMGYASMAAEGFGRTIGWYSRLAIRRHRSHVEGMHLLPREPAIFISWHSMNMLSLIIAPFLRRESAFQTFVPGGLTGAAMRGWLAATVDNLPVLIEEDSTASVRAAMATLARGLDRGHDVIVAADGPAGPAKVVRPGALWLARFTGYPLVPVGCAAWPAVQLPRWDRLVIPLPGARGVAVIQAPIWLPKGQAIDRPVLESIRASLDVAATRAWDIVSSSAAQVNRLTGRFG